MPRPADAAPAARTPAARTRPGDLWHAVPPLVRAFLVADLVVGLLYILTSFAPGSRILPERVMAFFDLNREHNLPSWYSAAQLFLIGVLLAILAAAVFSARGRRHLGAREAFELPRHRAREGWAVALAAASFLFLSLDEATILHENLSKWLDRWHTDRRATPFRETGLWMFICAPLFCAVMVLAGHAAYRLFAARPAALWLYVAGITIFVIAAAGIEAASNLFPTYSRSWRVTVLLEEVGEMIGATLMFWGTLELLRGHGRAIAHLSGGRASSQRADGGWAIADAERASPWTDDARPPARTY